MSRILVFKLQHALEPPGGLIVPKWLGPTFRVPDSVSLEGDPIIFIFNMFPCVLVDLGC